MKRQRKKTEKSNDPKIASMSIHLTNDLLALGITPVGSVIGGDLKDFLPHAKEQLKDTKKTWCCNRSEYGSVTSVKAI